MIITGYGPSTAPLPDPHGEAALLLVESLIHHLISRSVMKRADALHVIQIAIDTLVEIGVDRGEPALPVPLGVRLLSLIRESLAIDIA